MRGLPEEAPFSDSRSFLEAGGTALPRLVIVTVACLIASAVGWAGWATVDEIVKAPGHAEPQGQVKLVNHPHGGKVADLFVREGEMVEPGAALLRLDPRIARSEYEELLGRLQQKRVEVARLESEAHDLPLVVAPKLLATRPDLVDAQLQLQQARKSAFATRRDTLNEALSGRRSAVATAAAERARATEGAAHMDEQLGAIRQLSDRGLYPKLKLVAAEKQLSDANGEKRKAETEFAGARAALAEAQSRLQSLERDWRSQVLDELAHATAERDRLAEQLTAEQAVLDGLQIVAPVAGTVLDLRVTAVGQSVAPNEPIMKLVPHNETLIVEARVRNEDIGRVSLGMPATVKVRAYDYLRHGTLAGQVIRIAADATPEQEADKLSYVVSVAVDRQQLGAAAGDRIVVPGMAVDVELKAGRRTILGYLTDRIWRTRDSAFTEG